MKKNCLMIVLVASKYDAHLSFFFFTTVNQLLNQTSCLTYKLSRLYRLDFTKNIGIFILNIL